MPSGRVSRFDGRRKTGADRAKTEADKEKTKADREKTEKRDRTGTALRQAEPGQGDGSFVRIYHTKDPSPQAVRTLRFLSQKGNAKGNVYAASFRTEGRFSDSTPPSSEIHLFISVESA